MVTTAVIVLVVETLSWHACDGMLQHQRHAASCARHLHVEQSVRALCCVPGGLYVACQLSVRHALPAAGLRAAADLIIGCRLHLYN